MIITIRKLRILLFQLERTTMTCALCTSDTPLQDFPVSGEPFGASVAVCGLCVEQMSGSLVDSHWRIGFDHVV